MSAITNSSILRPMRGMATAIVQATTHFDDAKILADISKGLGAPMRGIALETIPEQERLAVRGW